jgi:hypothetical protein
LWDFADLVSYIKLFSGVFFYCSEILFMASKQRFKNWSSVWSFVKLSVLLISKALPLSVEGYGSLVCHWFIYARANHKILLYFDDFEVEGNPGGKL